MLASLQRGRIMVNGQMQVPKYPHIMAIGDLIEGVRLSRQLSKYVVLIDEVNYYYLRGIFS